jgi:hydrogenase maturation protease
VVERLVLGLGNLDRGDDGVGRIVVRSLRPRAPADVRLLEQSGEASALLAELQEADCAWLIDAAQSGAPPGTIHRIDCAATDVALPSGTVSSHGFGLAEAIALARTLDLLPSRCVVYAVEAADFTLGAEPSPHVAAAVDEVARRILEELHA